MFIDDKLKFAENKSIAHTAGTVAGTSPLDLNAAGTDLNGNSYPGDLGREPLDIYAIITEAVVGSGASVNFQVVKGDALSGSAIDTPVVVQETGPIGVATLVKGYRLPLGRLPPEQITNRYVDIQAVVSGATTTAGKFSAYLVASPS